MVPGQFLEYPVNIRIEIRLDIQDLGIPYFVDPGEMDDFDGFVFEWDGFQKG
jgi:hypothetical protein